MGGTQFKTKSKILCVLVILFLMGQLAPVTAHEPAQNLSIAPTAFQEDLSPGEILDIPVTRDGSPTLEDETKAKWSISWTATATKYKETTDGSGGGLLYDWRARMAGFAIRRYYVDRPWEEFNLPFSMTFTQEYHRVGSERCVGGGVRRSEEHRWVIDPNRYSAGPDLTPRVNRLQREDGTWYIYDPFHGFPGCAGMSCAPRNYTERYYGGHTLCDGSKSYRSRVSELPVPIEIFGWPGEIDGDASGTTFSKQVQFQIGSDPPMIIDWDITVRLLGDQDLTVERLEVTQGIQDVANTIPLVQGRRTVVRAYLGIGADSGPMHGVSGVLRGYSGGALLGQVNPFNPDGVISAKASPDWRQIDDTLNFELPNAWTLNNPLRLEVEVNPGRGVVETNYENNKGSADVSFRACSPLSIAYKPIHYAPPGDHPPSDPGADIAVGHEFLRKVYPVANNELKYIPWPGMAWSEIMHTGTFADIAQASSDLADRLARDYLLGFVGSEITSYPDRLIGWLPADACSEINGQANGIPGVAAWVAHKKNPDYWRATFAHEIGHTYGLRHNSLTTNGRHWFDVYDRGIKPGAPDLGGLELYDFIHTPGLPEPERWVSAESYEHLIKQYCPASGRAAKLGATETATIQAQAATTDTLLVTGIISITTPTGGFLQPLYHQSAAALWIPPAGYEYCLKLKNDTVMLSQYCFDADLEIEAPTPITPTSMSFGLAVPLPEGLNRVELTKGPSTVLSSRVASAHPPTVTVQFPTAAGLTLQLPQTVQWIASDPDGDSLTYSVLYSADGGTNWISLGSGIPGVTSYTVDFSGVPGSSQALVKVLASDGFYSAEDVSDNVFAVPNKPPTAAIISPPPGARLNASAPAVLEGLGADLEDGSMDDGTLHWTSDRDGTLGTGRLLEVTLSSGVHTVTLTAIDGGGLTATDSISMTILSPDDWRPNRVYLPAILRL